jgi:hypothetical protein
MRPEGPYTSRIAVFRNGSPQSGRARHPRNDNDVVTFPENRNGKG